MKVNELMLGDWVNYRPGWINEGSGKVEYESDQGFPVKIEMMYESRGEGLVQYNDGENDGIEAAEYELFPLPLTAEILEKNGWVKFHMFYRLQIDDSQYMEYYPHKGRLERIYDHKDGYHEIVFTVHGLNYVHLLQHALQLCGIDQKIKI